MASIEQILVCRGRWLNALSSGHPSGPLIEDSLRGCRDAVVHLGARLEDLGYPVSTFLLPCPANLDERVTQIEAHTGVPIPKLIPAFWRIVGGITLVDLRQYKHVVFWDDLGMRGAHQFCDGVHVDVCDDEWLAYTADDFTNHAEDGDEESFLYSLAPDGYHKDDISGGPPYAIGRGSDWVPTWENFHWPGYHRPVTAVPDPPDFVSYLRTAILECAGFPGFFGSPDFEGLRRVPRAKLVGLVCHGPAVGGSMPMCSSGFLPPAQAVRLASRFPFRSNSRAHRGTARGHRTAILRSKPARRVKLA